MGRASIRAAAVGYLQGLNLPYVGTIFSARPLIATESDYDVTMSGLIATSSHGSSAFLVVNLPDEKRHRESLTGRSAVDDSVIHNLVVEVFFANTSGDALSAQADHDTLIDAIVTGLRADPLLGQPATVWSAGEFEAGIEVHQHEPFTGLDNTTIFMPATIEFEAWEWVSGPV